MRTNIGIFLMLLGSSSMAQVIKCTDPKTKQVTYTDSACPASAEVKQIEPRQSEEYKAYASSQALDAKQRIAQSLQRERDATVGQESTSPVYSGGNSDNATSNSDSMNPCNCKGYAGPGGPCYAGPGGPANAAKGGPAYKGPGGACYAGPGGPANVVLHSWRIIKSRLFASYVVANPRDTLGIAAVCA